MKIIRKVSQMQKIALKYFQDGDEAGLVPTMGALHEGHVSLIDKSVRNDDITIVSIFVNPTQFGLNEDYLKYPRPFEKDVAICKKNHVDYIFAPSVNEMFPAAHKTFIEVKQMQDVLCGSFRKGHFRGVATVVAKLFNITFAERAYFGMKDFQQLKIIERMAKDLNFRTKIVPCPVVREKSGLALSSRNSYLSQKEKNDAVQISKILKEAKKNFSKNNVSAVLKDAIKKLNKISGSKIDYAEILDANTLSRADKASRNFIFAVAVWVGKTRLIDNVVL
ncbi:pantoate--beta-alanine ligase [Endomicrobium proavitum]|uniref:Pantothenate synthetase n=1 Tax=Endomicrobium proavitum TaxID=1408281 RepID=A0A0G3WKV8_9BACT|nr:pantoate--beta-alanine ligase [Endomicrobium proavitum]AKL98129.1 Pantothenate synthetase [Endomicrobium proavitum]